MDGTSFNSVQYDRQYLLQMVCRTRTGIWFDYKVQRILDKVTGKHDKAVAKKSPQVDMFEKPKEDPLKRTDGGPSK